MVSRNRNMQGGKSIVFDLAPRTPRGNTGQVHNGLVRVLDTPVLSTATSISGGFTFTITNYSVSSNYVLSTTAGSVARSGATVTQSGLGFSTSATVSVTATESNFPNSAVATRAGTSAACVPAGCTPPSCTLTTSTGMGALFGGCGSPGCTGGCLYYTRTTYTYTANYCVDNCGNVIYGSCPADYFVDSTPYICA